MFAKLSSQRLVSCCLSISKQKLATSCFPQYRQQLNGINRLQYGRILCGATNLQPIRLFSNAAATTPNPDPESEEAERLEKEKQRIRQKKVTKYTLLGMLAMFSGTAIYIFFSWGAPKLDEKGEPIPDEYSDLPFVIQYSKRAWETVANYEKIMKEPSSELLLPPPVRPPYYQPPYTLVLEMTNVLVHPEWSFKTGWRFKKRPFLDYFLHQCATSLNFEIVIYTHEVAFTAFPLLNSLDPNGYLAHRLFRDATRYENGVFMKDLNCLNRDLHTVVHVDWDEKACQLNRDNCLKLKKWDGDSNDQTLYDLTNFLMAIANEKVQDVREVLRYYSQFDDPLAVFRENQRKLAEQEKEKAEKEQPKASPYSSFLNKILKWTIL